MSDFKYTAGDYKPEPVFDLLEEGLYTFKIIEVEDRFTKDNLGNEINVKLLVITGKNRDKYIYQTWMYNHPDAETNENIQWRLNQGKNRIDGILSCTGKKGINYFQELIDLIVDGYVVQSPNKAGDKIYNNIKFFQTNPSVNNIASSNDIILNDDMSDVPF